jgi:hypothetical protein
LMDDAADFTWTEMNKLARDQSGIATADAEHLQPCIDSLMDSV